MKKKELRIQLPGLLGITAQFLRIHKDNFAAMKAVYSRLPVLDEARSSCQAIVLKIVPYGNLYKIFQTCYQKGDEVKESWTAYYSFLGSGYLYEIGGSRIAYFDSAHKQIHLERYDDVTGVTRADIFYSNQIDWL